MIPILAPLLLKFSGFSSAAKGLLTRIPKPVWEALSVLGYALALYATHSRAVHVHDTAIIAANNAQWQTKLNAETAAVKAKDAELATMSAQIRKANDDENARIAADAGSLRLLGPGKAVCPRVPVAPAGAGGHVAPGRPGDAPVAPLPDARGIDLLALPFDDTITFGATADGWRAEVLSWREWYAKLVATWPKSPPQAAPDAR